MQLQNTIFILMIDGSGRPVDGFEFSLKKLMKKEMPIKISWQIKKFEKQFNENKKIYNEQRDQLLEKYCIKNEDGSYTIPTDKEKNELFFKETKELIDILNEYNIEKIKLPDNIGITPNDLEFLSPILDLE